MSMDWLWFRECGSVTKVNDRLDRHGESLSALKTEIRDIRKEYLALRAMIGVIIETINPTKKP